MGIFVLDATTESIVVAMSGAAATTNPDFTSAWADDTGSAFTEGSTDGALNGTSSVTLVAAPAAATRRVVKNITIYNKDTAAVTITVSFNANSTLRNIAKVTLQVGDTWTLDGAYDTTGALKQTLGTVNLTSGVTGTLAVANGGTGITSGTSGGVPYFSGSTTIASSAALAANALVIGGGAGVAPSTTTTGTGILTFLGTPSSANLAAAVTDETGTGALVFATSPTLVTPVLGTPTSGNLSNCTADGTNNVGYRNIPQSGSDKTTSYSLATTDVGKFVGVGTSGSITVPNSTFAAGDVVSIFNNTSGNVTLTMSITTAYIAGTNTDKDTITLATRGVATILFISGTVCVVSGNVS